jgi:hypothetical protein
VHNGRALVIDRKRRGEEGRGGGEVEKWAVEMGEAYM